MVKKVEIRLQNIPETIGGIVITYLKNPELFSGKEGQACLRDAMVAFLEPYAIQAKSGSEEEQSQAAERSIAALMRQLDRICLDFNKPLPHLATAAVREPMPPAAADPPVASSSQSVSKERSADGVRLSIDVKSVFASIL